MTDMIPGTTSAHRIAGSSAGTNTPTQSGRSAEHVTLRIARSDRASRRPLGTPRRSRRRWPAPVAAWAHLLKRAMCARPVIIGQVVGQDSSQVPLANDDHMVQTLPPD